MNFRVNGAAAASAALNPSELYLEWKRYGHHLEEYGSELLGTGFMVFCVIGVVAFMFGSGSPIPPMLPSTRLRLFLTGLLLGGSGWLVALSPPGRLSGAHINPAVSFGFWVLGKMHFRDLLGYIAGQAVGGILGALLGRACFGRLALEVHQAALQPGSMVSPVENFSAEAAATFVLAFVVYSCVSSRRWLRWTPAVATAVVGILVALDGKYSGCGINPARWLGPALLTGQWSGIGAYCFGPLLGALLAALPRRIGWLEPRRPHTGKLFHDPQYRSVFKHDRVPTAERGL